MFARERRPYVLREASMMGRATDSSETRVRRWSGVAAFPEGPLDSWRRPCRTELTFGEGRGVGRVPCGVTGLKLYVRPRGRAEGGGGGRPRHPLATTGRCRDRAGHGARRTVGLAPARPLPASITGLRIVRGGARRVELSRDGPPSRPGRGAAGRAGRPELFRPSPLSALPAGARGINGVSFPASFLCALSRK